MSDTNLHDKVTTLITQMSADTSDIVDAINALTSYLGGTPTAPTITLADVVAALTTSNTLLGSIRSEQATQTTAIVNALNSLDTSLAVIIDNNSTNTKYLLTAIYATFCACTTTAPLLAPPIDVTPTTLVDDEKCKRIQFYLSVFGNWLNKIANYGAATGAITGDVLGTLLAAATAEAGIVATGAEVGAVAGPPGVMVGAAIALITGAIYLLGSAFLQSYVIQFNATVFQHTLLLALYNATNAADGEIAFEDAVAAEMGIPAGPILSCLWYSAWSNDLYSGLPVVDDSAFDGSICAPPVESECVTLSSYHVDAYGGSHVLPVVAATYTGKFYKLHMATGYVQTYFDPGLGFTNMADGYTGQFTQDGHTDANSGSAEPSYQFWGIAGTNLPFTVEICPTNWA